MQPHKLEIEYVPIDSLKLNPRNPRIHSDKQVRQLADSIEEFGFNLPILVASNRVVAGHGRIKACRLLGISEVPICRLEHLTEQQIQAYTIADNRLTENSRWDRQLLGMQLQELAKAEIDFDIEITGFETAEIDLLIEGLDDEEAEVDPADILPPVSRSCVSQSGDLWVLDDHRIFCGNALAAEAYEALFQGRRANMVFTDPPYNVPIAGNVSGRGKCKHGDFLMASGEMSEEQFREFLKTACHQLVAHATDTALHFIFCDWRHIGTLLDTSKSLYSELLNLCVWVKNNAGLGSFYRSQHELICIFRNGDRHLNNVQLGRFGRSRTNVWNYPCATSFSRSSAEGDLLSLHPTVKPVELLVDAIRDCTKRSDIVLDPFLGSGTTVVAAQRAGRICYGLELDGRYVDTAVRRWERFTGQSAVHYQTGQTFSEREKEHSNVE